VVLGGLLAVLIAVWWLNRTDPETAPAAARTPAVSVPAVEVRTPARPVNRPVTRSSVGGRGLQAQEFHPTLKPKDPIDPSKIDPTLRLDVLARLRGVRGDGGGRTLFEFASAPAPPVQIAKVAPIIPKPLQDALTTGPVKETPPAPPPPPPPPPAIPLKFYGYSGAQRQGPKRAFFLEGEDIFVAGEGETIKNRYKIIRIGVNSAVVEDTQHRHQQTLPLVEEMASS
jgi:hypothetical protein